MPVGELPLVGEYSIMGFLFLVIVWFIYAIITGRLVTKLTLDEQRRNADTWNKAWQKEVDRADHLSDLVDDLKVVGENMEKVLNSLPVPLTGGDET